MVRREDGEDGNDVEDAFCNVGPSHAMQERKKIAEAEEALARRRKVVSELQLRSKVRKCAWLPNTEMPACVQVSCAFLQ